MSNYHPQENYIETVNGHSFKMIFVKGGTFGMGESQKHMVTVPDFHIGEFPVTQALWKAVMNGDNPSFFIGDNRPVEQVSWDDIVKGVDGKPSFLDELNAKTTKHKGYKLPSEAMWEFAARGREKYRKYEFSGSNRLKEVGWYGNFYNSGSHHSETMPVGLKLPNKLGLYDMSGNVREWCEDNWKGGLLENLGVNDNVNHIPKNGLPFSGKYNNRSVVRGGSWNPDGNVCRVSYRDNFNRSLRGNHLGFRLVRY